MTRTVYTLDDVGGALSWRSLMAFIKYLGTDSALARDLGKSTGWETPLKTNAILADLFDLLQANTAVLRHVAGDKRRRKIKPYPRPGADKDNKRKLGKDPVPVEELREMIRRRGHNGNERQHRSGKGFCDHCPEP